MHGGENIANTCSPQWWASKESIGKLLCYAWWRKYSKYREKMAWHPAAVAVKNAWERKCQANVIYQVTLA